MPWLLNLAYLAVLAACSPWLVVAAIRRGKYRHGFSQKLLGRAPIREGTEPCLWLHAVSVGEVNLLAPLLDRLKRDRPAWRLVLSTTTVAGMDLARQRYPRLTVFYCPLDFSWSVRRAIERVRPSCLALVELELWPNLIRAARRHGARVVVINGRLSDRSFRGYRLMGRLLRRVLADIDDFGMQSTEYADRFERLGVPADRLHVTGSLKFDGAAADRSNPQTEKFRRLAGFSERETVFLAGSTQAEEERLAIEAFKRVRADHPALRLVLVPRQPHRFEDAARLLEASGLTWRRRTQLADPPAPGDCPDALLVDCVGELGAWWGTATVGFVGGSFGKRGGQNMIEPAAYGVATCFGPDTQNFRDVVRELLNRDGAVVVRTADELTEFLRRCLCDPQYACALGRRAQTLVQEQVGAVERTAELLAGALGAVARLQSSIGAKYISPAA